MDWVLDASIALAWALPDEASDQADRFLSRVTAKDVLWVPSLWWYEVAYLELALRKGLGLATADRNLQSASKKAGVKILRH